MNSRRILCSGDPIVLAGMPLLTLAKLLARAIVHHLGDYAVVFDPHTETSTFYTPTSIINMPPTPDFSAVDAETMTIYNMQPPRTVHYLVVDHPTLDAFLGVASAFFDVVTPFIAYAHRFLPLPATMTSWLLPTGRAMPAILLPSSPKGNAGDAKFYTIDDGWNAPHPPERDACRMRLTPVQVNDAAGEPNWNNVNKATKATFERWARTVAWKRVGICISGGGASVYRLVNLFDTLEHKQLPIDLLAGVSGGTGFAACYATGGLDRVRALANRWRSQSIVFMGSLLTSRFVERYMDNFLGDCGVCNTEIRVIALCTSIAPLSPPRPAVVVDGTFGQAIRASGGAPFFGPYFHGDTRQTDGATLAGLPPPFLAERFGADIIFAMNVLSLPQNRFPGETIPVVGNVLGFFYRYTPLGRVADTWSATSTMLHTIAEGAGLHADVFIDRKPADWAPMEQALLHNAPQYALEGLTGYTSQDLDDVADDFIQRWRALP